MKRKLKYGLRYNKTIPHLCDSVNIDSLSWTRFEPIFCEKEKARINRARKRSDKIGSKPLIYPYVKSKVVIMGKITTLSEIEKEIKPNTATLVGGGFDLFHVGHLRYLKKSSNFGRPLVVVIQSDKVVFVRKGFGRPIIGEKQRAHLVSAIECVDYVLILDKPSHYDGYLKKIKPKRLIFYKENLIYRMRRAKEIRKRFPHIQVIFVKDKKIISTSNITEKIMRSVNFDKITDRITKRLHELASKSTSNAGKISSILVRNGQIIEEAMNDKNDRHAESLILESIKKNKISVNDCELYVLIPPCLICSELLIKSPLKKIYYLYPYGNDDGLKLLRKNSVVVKRYK